MIFIRRIAFLLNLLLVLYTLLVYQLCYKVNVQHWLGGFLMLTMPILLILNILCCLIWLFISSRNFFLSLICLVLGYPLFTRSFHLNLFQNKNVIGTKKISVLSYNLMWCDAERYLEKKDSTNAQLITQTIMESNADVKCFQELYNYDKLWALRLIRKLKDKNPYYTYIHARPGNDQGQGEIGLAIFSKYPIINKHEVYWKPNHNGLLSVDILVGKDTLRVINVQLKSMGIRVEKVIENRSNEEMAKKEALTIFGQLKTGFERRAEQVKILENWIDASPYPTLVCGDFNELPYGYAYGRIRNKMKNAFEEAGTGFGFTYHYMPNFIRIDNQFYGKGLEVYKFRTLSDIKYSDHYPIYGEYVIK